MRSCELHDIAVDRGRFAGHIGRERHAVCQNVKMTRACVADFIASRIDIDGDGVAGAGAGFVAYAGDNAACPCGSGGKVAGGCGGDEGHGLESFRLEIGLQGGLDGGDGGLLGGVGDFGELAAQEAASGLRGSVGSLAGIELPSSSVVAGAMRVGVRSKLMQASGVPSPLYLPEMARLSE
jgi:hypothetical protein